MNKITVNSNHALLEYLAKNELLRTYAYFIKFKYLFSSSRLNKGNRAKISRMTGLSDKTVRTYIKEMLKLEWCIEDNGDIVFRKRQDLYSMYDLPKHKATFKCRVFIDSEDSIPVIMKKLAPRVIEANLIRQEVFIRKRRGHSYNSIVNERGKDNNNYRIRNGNYSLTTSGVSSKPLISCWGIGRLFGRSRTFGHSLKVELAQMGLIEVEKQPLRLMKRCRGNYKAYLRFKESRNNMPGLFYSGLDCFLRVPDIITITAI